MGIFQGLWEHVLEILTMIHEVGDFVMAARTSLCIWN